MSLREGFVLSVSSGLAEHLAHSEGSVRGTSANRSHVPVIACIPHSPKARRCLQLTDEEPGVEKPAWAHASEWQWWDLNPGLSTSTVGVLSALPACLPCCPVHPKPR